MKEPKLSKEFTFEDVDTLREAREMELTNLGIDYNECGGSISGYDNEDNQVLIVMNENSEDFYDEADGILTYLRGE